jgi:SAM-dependent methyltransferase
VTGAEATSRGRSFDAWAADYDRFGPRYPDELFDAISTALELPARPDVADLGAGTGAASIAMARRDWRVHAVEPGSGMRETLAPLSDGGGWASRNRCGARNARGIGLVPEVLETRALKRLPGVRVVRDGAPSEPLDLAPAICLGPTTMPRP